jgi:ubiquinol-cytochrome c reductase iron-sulfur subunit
MRALGRYLLAALVLLLARGRRHPALERPEFRPSARAEVLVLGLLGLATLASAAFVFVYFRGADTQWLAVALGVALAALGAASAVTSTRLVRQEKEVEPRPELGDPEKRQELVATAAAGVSGITRKRLLLTAAMGAVGALVAAFAVPALSLGPNAEKELTKSPWRRGRRLVDEDGDPLVAEEIAVGSVRTAFPEGADREQLPSPVVVVRIPEDELDLPSERRDWAPRGILAYSKICTHAGCAVALFRYPSFVAKSPKPALVCPCHYSTFDVARAGDVVFGPAGRALPQLPLDVDPDGNLVAGGDFSGRVGPAWWGVRKGKPS